MRTISKKHLILAGLTILAAACVVFVFAVKPAIERITTLERVIPQKQRTLEELRAKGRQYSTLRAELDNLRTQAASADSRFELLAFLESITNECGLSKKVATIKQGSSQLDSNHTELVVEVRLENIALRQLIDFLVRTKSSNHLLLIKSLYTTKGRTNPDLLDAVIEISTLRLNKPT